MASSRCAVVEPDSLVLGKEQGLCGVIDRTRCRQPHFERVTLLLAHSGDFKVHVYIEKFSYFIVWNDRFWKWGKETTSFPMDTFIKTGRNVWKHGLISQLERNVVGLQDAIRRWPLRQDPLLGVCDHKCDARPSNTTLVFAKEEVSAWMNWGYDFGTLYLDLYCKSIDW